MRERDNIEAVRLREIEPADIAPLDLERKRDTAAAAQRDGDMIAAVSAPGEVELHAIWNRVTVEVEALFPLGHIALGTRHWHGRRARRDRHGRPGSRPGRLRDRRHEIRRSARDRHRQGNDPEPRRAHLGESCLQVVLHFAWLGPMIPRACKTKCRTIKQRAAGPGACGEGQRRASPASALTS
jgi:hypothetical protein